MFFSPDRFTSSTVESTVLQVAQLSVESIGSDSPAGDGDWSEPPPRIAVGVHSCLLMGLLLETVGSEDHISAVKSSSVVADWNTIHPVIRVAPREKAASGLWCTR